MNKVSCSSLLILCGLILALSLSALLINQFIYQYPGTNYFPEGIPLLVLILFLINLGLILCFKKNSKPRLMGKELIYFFLIMSVIATATNAAQLTPFPIIDHYIITLETKLHIYMLPIINWTHNYPHFKYLLGLIYDSLTYQMCFLPLFVIATGRIYLLREYYFFLLCTVLIGFSFYYFFPTIAPAGMMHSPLFFPEQLDTSLKFRQIHHHIMPTTNEGGLIALPSFHAIWAILCVNLVKDWPILFFSLIPINLLLILSCVLLGWHYVTDILGALIVLLISYYCFKFFTKPEGCASSL